MADPNIQNLTFPINTSTPGVIKTYSAEVNKKDGSMVVYDTTNLFQKDPVLRSDPVTLNGTKTFKTSFIGSPTTEEKKFLNQTVLPAADNQRAAYINKNFTKVQKETIFKGTPKVNNLAAPSEDKNTQTTSVADARVGQQKIDEIQKGISDGQIRSKYGNYRYPLALNAPNLKDKQDIIQFAMIRHIPTKLNLENASTALSVLERAPGDSQQRLGSVTMAIQSPISDTNYVGWTEGSMNPAQALGAAGALASIGAGAKGVKEFGGELSELVQGQNKALQTTAAAFFTGAATQNQEILQRTTGAIANPNLELLFQNPTLRDFNFTFILSPRDKDEANEIKNIIRFFKQGMSVKRASTGLFLKTPNTFIIKYQQKGETNGSKFLPNIKECALQSFSVNYTPAGNYATYNDGSMTAYELTMQFKELTPIYDDDYTRLPGGDNDKSRDYQIGY